MGAASVAVNVHIDGDTRLELHAGVNRHRPWLEVGDVTGSVALFFDPAGLERVLAALAELNNRMPAPDVKAAA